MESTVRSEMNEVNMKMFVLQFLSLDDIKEHNNITMKHDSDDTAHVSLVCMSVCSLYPC